MREGSVRDHVHALGLDSQLADQPRAPVLGVHDDRVEALVQPPLGRELPRTGLAREDVVRGQHERARAPPVAYRRAAVHAGWGQQPAVEVLDGEPLEVHDVGLAREAAVAQHVGDVLGEPARRAQARSGRAERVRGRTARAAHTPRRGGTGP